MQIIKNKTIATKIKKEPVRQNNSLPLLFLMLKLLMASTSFLIVSCTTSQEYIENNYATNIFYLDDEENILQRMYPGLVGDKGYIVEINEQVPSIRELISKIPVSLTVQNIPLDVVAVLKSARPEGSDYIDFYDYVLQNIDRIILCPKIKNALGFTDSDYKNNWPYKLEGQIYINSDYLRRFLGDKEHIAAIIIVHEVAHKEMSRLIAEGKISPKNWMQTERYAIIKEIEFREKTNWSVSKKDSLFSLAIYNRYYGLPDDDMTPFIFD